MQCVEQSDQHFLADAVIIRELSQDTGQVVNNGRWIGKDEIGIRRDFNFHKEVM